MSLLVFEVNVILLGAVTGAVYAASGYLKSRVEEKFDFRKFGQTVLLGAALGFLDELLGLDLDETSFESLGVMTLEVVFTENILKALTRHLRQEESKKRRWQR